MHNRGRLAVPVVGVSPHAYKPRGALGNNTTKAVLYRCPFLVSEHEAEEEVPPEVLDLL